ncbi:MULTISPECIES: (2Fe-2S)-binding protein [unclassified Burkholderia]|uniref:(2Fe-2S)-binding protein n=1 Tax=unclassified Burkholderia TaxID=2613784 RepID=UPI002AB139D3|nr:MULTISPECIES: (2Fe-2S)-binding protein [unclassified Burkholderia]
MATDSLFEPMAGAGAPTAETVAVTFNGEPMRVPAGASVAAALLAGGVRRFRSSPVSGDGRAPYCMMGVCFECLLEIDGVANRQSCLVSIENGMRIRTQDSLPERPDDAGNAVTSLTKMMEAGRG